MKCIAVEHHGHPQAQTLARLAVTEDQGREDIFGSHRQPQMLPVAFAKKSVTYMVD